jgi:hypothetical protein
MPIPIITGRNNRTLPPLDEAQKILQRIFDEPDHNMISRGRMVAKIIDFDKAIHRLDTSLQFLIVELYFENPKNKFFKTKQFSQKSL